MYPNKELHAVHKIECLCFPSSWHANSVPWESLWCGLRTTLSRAPDESYTGYLYFSLSVPVEHHLEGEAKTLIQSYYKYWLLTVQISRWQTVWHLDRRRSRRVSAGKCAQSFLLDVFVTYRAICAQSAIHHCLSIAHGLRLSQTIFCDLCSSNCARWSFVNECTCFPKAYRVPPTRRLCFRAARQLWMHF